MSVSTYDLDPDLWPWFLWPVAWGSPVAGPWVHWNPPLSAAVTYGSSSCGCGARPAPPQRRQPNIWQRHPNINHTLRPEQSNWHYADHWIENFVFCFHTLKCAPEVDINWTLGTKFNGILIEIHTFSLKTIHLKMAAILSRLQWVKHDTYCFQIENKLVLPKKFYGSSDIFTMCFMYSIQNFEISHQTFGPRHRKSPTCLMIFVNTEIFIS